MLVVDPQTHRVMAVNEAAIFKYEYSRAEFLSLTFESIFPMLKAGISDGPDYAGVWPHRTKSGKTIAAEVVQTDVCFDGQQAILLMSGDVTSRHREATERRLRFAIGELLASGDWEVAAGAIEVFSDWLGWDQDAVVGVDRAFKIMYWNPAAERLFARPAEEVVGTEYLVGTHAILPREEIAVHKVEATHGGRWKGVIAFADLQNKTVVLETTLWVLPDKAGEVQGYLSLHRNITDRRQRPGAPRATDRRKRPVYSGLGTGVWEIDLKTGEPRWSKELYRIYGIDYETGRITRREWTERIHPDDREFIMRALASSWRPQMLDHQYRILWPDGSVHWLHTKSTAVFDSHTCPSKLIGVDLDVTAAKRAETSNREFAAIVEFTDLAIFSTDLAGNIVNWNSGAERIFGYSGEEIAGSQVRMLAPLDHRPPLDEIGERLRRGQKTEHRESVCIAKNGECIQILLSAAPILDQTRTAVGGAYIMWDVTELRMLQRQLVQAQKLESIGQLAAGIAHEINTPIQYIGDNAKFLGDGFQDLFHLADSGRQIAEVLRAAGRDDLVSVWDKVAGAVDLEYLRGEVPLAIEQLLQGVNHVARIVRAMREFSHPGSVEKTLADINRAIESTALVSKNEWKYVADLTTDLETNLPTIPCVAGEFNQVILNLIVNASHAIADVVRGTERKGAIKITTRRKDPFVEIRVIDTGSGIPEKIQSKVFDPFFTTKDVGKGTGQGLAIAHSVIVQKHHGSIRFETKEGEGTTFIIQLPLTSGSEER